MTTTDTTTTEPGQHCDKCGIGPFFHVAARQYPTLCLDCADDAARGNPICQAVGCESRNTRKVVVRADGGYKYFCAEHEDRPTYRQRREARAARLNEWADKREAKADAAATRADAMASVIPFGQPILVGHYSEGRDRRYRDRIGRTMDAAIANGRKADEMRSKAANIASAADHAIYGDDPDAIERLTERIAELEAERDRVKAYNASCRKGQRDVSLLDDQQRALIVRIAQIQSYALGKNGAFPGYHLTNLSGNIKRNRDRLASLAKS